MKGVLAVCIAIVACLCRAGPEPVLFPVATDDAVHAVGWLEDALWVDYSSGTNVPVAAARSPSGRVEVVWARTNLVEFAWMSDRSVYGPYLGMDLEVLRRYAARRVHGVHAMTVLGVRLYQQKQLQESLACFREVDRLDPGSERAAELYSAIVVRAGQPGEAVQVVRTLLDRFPDNPNIRFNLACAYALHGKAEPALELLLYLAKSEWKDLIYYLADPDLASLQADPRFRSMQDALNKQQIDRIIERFHQAKLVPAL